MNDKEFFEQKYNEAATRLKAQCLEHFERVWKEEGTSAAERTDDSLELIDLAYAPVGGESIALAKDRVLGTVALEIDLYAADDAARFYRGYIEHKREKWPQAHRADHDAERDARSYLEFSIRSVVEERLALWELATESKGTPYFKHKTSTDVLHYICALDEEKAA